MSLLSLFLIKSSAQNCQAYFYSYSGGGTTMQFSDSSWTNSGNLIYAWDFGDGGSSTLSNPGHTYNQNGLYVVCLSIISTTGCRDTYCDTIQVGSIVNPPCSASFTYTTDTTNYVYFTSITGGLAPLTYQWDFGDGSVSSQANPIHGYNNSGVYVVSLTVNTANGLSCNMIDSVFVNSCEAIFTSNISGSGSVNFTNQSIVPPQTTFAWDFGDGSPRVYQRNATHTYLNSGTYVVSLSTFNASNNCSDTYKDTININVPPNCVAGYTYTISNATVSFTNTASNYNSIKYVFGDGDSSSLPNPVHTYAQSGTYVVWQIVKKLSCVDVFTDTITVSISPACQAGFNYTVNQGSVQFSSTAQNYSSIFYDFGDGSTSNQPNPSHTYLQNGNYLVCQTVSNSNGCSDTFCDTISVNISQPCQADYGYFLSQDTLMIQNLAQNFDSLLYDFGDGNYSTLLNPTHIYSQAGTYIVCQTVYNSNGCSDTKCDTLLVAINTCNAGFTYQQQGDSIYFYNTATNYTSIQYDFGDGSSSSQANPLHHYTNSGTYVVKQTVLNISRSCVDVFRDTISVSVSTSCFANFQIGIDTNNIGTLYLINTSSNDKTHSYSWSFGDGSFDIGRLPTHVYQNYGPHEVCLTIYDTVMNCTSTYCDTVGLDSTGKIVKSRGYTIKVLEGDFIGVEESNPLSKLSIYPNPVVDAIRFNIKMNESYFYQLFNINSQVMTEGKMHGNIINLSELKAGVYFIRISNGKESIVKKLIKQNK